MAAAPAAATVALALENREPTRPAATAVADTDDAQARAALSVTYALYFLTAPGRLIMEVNAGGSTTTPTWAAGGAQEETCPAAAAQLKRVALKAHTRSPPWWWCWAASRLLPAQAGPDSAPDSAPDAGAV